MSRAINFVPGKRDGDGYEYLADGCASYRVRSPIAHGEEVYHLAQQLGVSVEVVFLWRHRIKPRSQARPDALLARSWLIAH